MPSAVSADQPDADARDDARDRRPTVATEPAVETALMSGTGWPVTALREGSDARPADTTEAPTQVTIWDATATGGVAIGRGSQKAAVSTASLFTRVGKSVAGAFAR
jgi:hypothetical protein